MDYAKLVAVRRRIIWANQYLKSVDPAIFAISRIHQFFEQSSHCERRPEPSTWQGRQGQPMRRLVSVYLECGRNSINQPMCQLHNFCGGSLQSLFDRSMRKCHDMLRLNFFEDRQLC